MMQVIVGERVSARLQQSLLNTGAVNDLTHHATRQASYLHSAPPLEKHVIFQR